MCKGLVLWKGTDGRDCYYTRQKIGDKGEIRGTGYFQCRMNKTFAKRGINKQKRLYLTSTYAEGQQAATKQKISEIGRVMGTGYFEFYDIKKCPAYKRHIKKNDNRRRGLGFNPITPCFGEEYVWHHINKEDVVSYPKKLHQSISHSLNDEKSMIEVNSAWLLWACEGLNT